MARIADILESGPTYSYEFSPPKDVEQAVALRQTIGELAITTPDFISFTYGALGNTRETTKNIAIEQNTRWDFPTMAHLTCVQQSREEILELVDEYAANGLENILALRGDGDDSGDFAHAIDLASFIKQRHPGMSIGVAAHPEVHPRSINRKTDREYLAAKLEIADFAVTQFFFDPGYYHRLVDELDALGSNKPVIPGIMLFTSPAGLKRMAEMNNTSLPQSLTERLELLNSPDDIGKIAVETAVELIEDLQSGDIPGLHIYALNKSKPALELKQLIS